jgi:hypothetical protein
MPLAKAAPHRRPGDAPEPDSFVQRAVAIRIGQAWNLTDPRSEPTAWIKPKSEPDVRLDFEPRSEAKPEAEPKAEPEAEPEAQPNSNSKSLPDLDLERVAQRLAEHCAASGGPDHDHRHQLHAQQDSDCFLLQGRQQHRLLDEDSHRRVQRKLLNYGHQSWRRAPH